MSNQILIPSVMQIGRNATEQIPAILFKLTCKKPLIITDSTMLKLGYVERLLTILRAENIKAEVFSDTIAEPTEDSIVNGVNCAKEGKYDCLIAIGGG